MKIAIVVESEVGRTVEEEARGRGGEDRERNDWEKTGEGMTGREVGFGVGRLGGEVEVEGEDEEKEWGRSCCWSCMNVLTTQMGLVAAAVITPRNESGISTSGLWREKGKCI